MKKSSPKLKGKMSHWPKDRREPSKGSVGKTGSPPKTATKPKGNG